MNDVRSLSPAIKRTLLSCTSGVHFIEIPLCLLKRYVEFNHRYYGGVGGGGRVGRRSARKRTRMNKGGGGSKFGNLERPYFLNVPQTHIYHTI